MMQALGDRVGRFRFGRFRLALQCGVLSLMVWTIPMMLSSCSVASEPTTQSAASNISNDEADSPSRQLASAPDNAEVLKSLAAASAVYLGETHNELADHEAQLEIIQALNGQGEIAIALEMFQRPFQPVLDAYLADELTETELIAQSEYETRWGFDWEFYAPILRYAKDNQIPLIALNTPAEITRQVAREGLSSLSGDDLEFIPPVDEIDTSDEAYRALLQAVFSAHGGHGNSDGFENFFAAQVLWDETMAEGVVQQLAAEPDRQVVVLVGEAHVGYGYGIPNRVVRRLPEVAQVSVQFLSADEERDPAFADLVWMVGE